MLHHLLQHINKSVASGLSAPQRTAKGNGLTSQHALIHTSKTFILAIKITHFAATHANIACRNIPVSANIFEKLRHKALAKEHNLTVRFPFRIKIRTALATANRQTGQGVFEYLLKTQKFQNALVHRGMKTQTTFVRPNSAVKLNTITSVYPHHILIIIPRHPERNCALGLHQSFQQRNPTIFFLIGANRQLNGIQHLFYCLTKLRLVRIFGNHSLINFLRIRQ